MLNLHQHIRAGTALVLSLLFLVPVLGTTLHHYHADEHLRVHHCDEERRQRQHLHDPEILDWHHCQLCTVPAPVAPPAALSVALAPQAEHSARVPDFSGPAPLLQPRRHLSLRGPPAIS